MNEDLRRDLAGRSDEELLRLLGSERGDYTREELQLAEEEVLRRVAIPQTTSDSLAAAVSTFKGRLATAVSTIKGRPGRGRKVIALGIVPAVYAGIVFETARSGPGPEFSGLGVLLILPLYQLASIPVALFGLCFRRTRMLAVGLLLGFLISVPACALGWNYGQARRY